jgi:hypothetical protein
MGSCFVHEKRKRRIIKKTCECITRSSCMRHMHTEYRAVPKERDEEGSCVVQESTHARLQRKERQKALPARSFAQINSRLFQLMGSACTFTTLFQEVRTAPALLSFPPSRVPSAELLFICFLVYLIYVLCMKSSRQQIQATARSSTSP